MSTCLKEAEHLIVCHIFSNLNNQANRLVVSENFRLITGLIAYCEENTCKYCDRFLGCSSEIISKILTGFKD